MGDAEGRAHAGGEGQLRIRHGRGVVELPHGASEAHPRGGGSSAANTHLVEAGTQRCTPWWRAQRTWEALAAVTRTGGGGCHGREMHEGETSRRHDAGGGGTTNAPLVEAGLRRRSPWRRPQRIKEAPAAA